MHTAALLAEFLGSLVFIVIGIWWAIAAVLQAPLPPVDEHATSFDSMGTFDSDSHVPFWDKLS